MKRHPQFCGRHGSAQLIVLLVLVTVGSLVGLAVGFTSHNMRLSGRQRDLARTLAAADGAIEYAYAGWQAAIRSGGLQPPSTQQLTLTPPSAALHPGFAGSGITFTDFSLVATNRWGEPISDVSAAPPLEQVQDVPGFPGWRGRSRFYRAQVTAHARTRGPDLSVQVARHFQLTELPLFQACVSYEDDLEIFPGADLILRGPIHTNGNLWAIARNKLQFLDTVTYAGEYREAVNHPEAWAAFFGMEAPNRAPYWADNLQSGDSPPDVLVNTPPSDEQAAQLKQVSRIEPFGTDPSAIFDRSDSNPNNNGMRELIEPPDADSPDPPQIASRRLYNQAGVRVRINRSLPATNPNRVNVWVGGNQLATGTILGPAIAAAIELGTPLYDWREGGEVMVNTVDVKELNALLAPLPDFNGIIYIHDVTPGEKSAIRYANGAVLGRDYTFVSENGVYIQGDFNTGDNRPKNIPSNLNGNPTGDDSPIKPGYQKRSCAIIGDAINVLSNDWKDGNASRSLLHRIASHITINAALMGGIVPTNYEDNGLPSGGLTNFPRLLEHWGAADFTYWGSMVQQFSSEQFTGAWDTGNIYEAPGRRWNHDADLAQRPPPGEFVGAQYSRGRWERLK